MEPYNVGSPRRASTSAAAASTSSSSAIREPQAQPASAALKEGIMSCLQGAASLFASCCPCLSPSQDPMERMPLLNTPPNEAIRNEQPVAMAVVAQAPPLNDRCQLATTGWHHADPGFSWAKMDTDTIKIAKTDIIQKGMIPMLQELLGDEDMQNPGLQHRLKTCAATTPLVYSAEEFGFRSYYRDYLGDHSLEHQNLALTTDFPTVESKVLSYLSDTGSEKQRSLVNIIKDSALEKPIFLKKIANGETVIADPKITEKYIKNVEGSKKALEKNPTNSHLQERLQKDESLLREQKKLEELQTLIKAKCSTDAIQPDDLLSIKKHTNGILMEAFVSIQGQAFGSTFAINRDSAEPSVGLHLLTHELMHTLADPTTVRALLDSDSPTHIHMGDEGPNEFFARLASINAGLDSSTSTEKTPYKLNDAWADQALTRTLAKAYFLGDQAALQQAIAMGIPGQ
jgi:hypothetical protein